MSINIKRLMDLGCYRGFRHRRGLPVRGQRTAHQRPHPQGSGWRCRAPGRNKQGRKESNMAKHPSTPPRSACARRSARTSRTASRTCTRRSTTPSSRSPTARAALSWASAAARASGARASRTPFAAQVAAEGGRPRGPGAGHQEPRRRDQGPRPGRESSVRALASLGIRINSISDVTPVPHNGCRPQKRRRI